MYSQILACRISLGMSSLGRGPPGLSRAAPPRLPEHRGHRPAPAHRPPRRRSLLPRARGRRRRPLGRLDGAARAGPRARGHPDRRGGGGDRVHAEHLDGHEPDRGPRRRRRPRPQRRARVPGGHAALDPPRGDRALRPRRGRDPAPRIVPEALRAAGGHHRHQPRRVLERLPAGPRRVRARSRTTATSSSPPASPRACSRSTCGAAAWTGWPAPDTSGSGRATAPGSSSSGAGCSSSGRRARSGG